MRKSSRRTRLRPFLATAWLTSISACGRTELLPYDLEGRAGEVGGFGGSAGQLGGFGGAGGQGTAGQKLETGGSSGAGSGGDPPPPLGVFVMVDRSGSMSDCVDGTDRPYGFECPSPPARWDVAAEALKQFFRDPDAAGFGVALRFFPHDLPVAGCSGGQTGICDPFACARELVSFGYLTRDPAPIDEQEAALTAAVDGAAPDPLGSAPSQGTPTSAALSGALQWVQHTEDTIPDNLAAVILVTDGEPNGCIVDIDDIAGIAETAMIGHGIRTFVIGLTGENGTGLNGTDLDQLARAGGTEQAFFAADGVGLADELVSALGRIRDGS